MGFVQCLQLPLSFSDTMTGTNYFLLCRTLIAIFLVICCRFKEMQAVFSDVILTVMDEGRSVQDLSDKLLPANYKTKHRLRKQYADNVSQ